NSVSLILSTLTSTQIDSTEVSQNKPNFIFFIIDDMQPYHFNCLPEGKGLNLTPNIDRLAAEGTVMYGQHVSSSVCTPSRYSCLTGQYASRAKNEMFMKSIGKGEVTNVGWNTFILPDTITLPKLLKAHGYTTGAVGKNHVVECNEWVKLPYNSNPRDPKIKEQLDKNKIALRNAFNRVGFDFAERLYHHNPESNGPKELAVHNQDWITEGALNFIDQNAEKPFFLYFATSIPHGPGEAKRSWNADPLATADGILAKAPNVQPPRSSIPKRLKDAGIQQNDGRANILWLDDAIGAILKKLEEKKILNKTIIFFFTDHGQKSKGTVYQGGVSCPSIIWKEGGFPCGKKNNGLISNIDFTPTILDMAGIDPSMYNFDGKSFLPLLNGEKKEIHDSLYFEIGYTRAIRMGNWKYIALRYPEYAEKMTLEERRKILEDFNKKQKEYDKRWFTDDPSQPFSHVSLIPGGGGAEHASMEQYPAYYDKDQLYDLSKDPNEQNNLANNEQYAAKLAEMKDKLKSILSKLPGKFAEFQK
ncbi:MAG TPA: sulfatase-like hydrolase/transferase, partial [Victivallales bacterium]|nr:sulfatase-like hydrolase/transferase [Victivallales bacterium]